MGRSTQPGHPIATIHPYSGWIIAYSGSTLARNGACSILAPTATILGPAIWQKRVAPRQPTQADSSTVTRRGNGVFEPTLDANGFPNKQDYGNSYLKLSTAGNKLVRG